MTVGTLYRVVTNPWHDSRTCVTMHCHGTDIKLTRWSRTSALTLEPALNPCYDSRSAVSPYAGHEPMHCHDIRTSLHAGPGRPSSRIRFLPVQAPEPWTHRAVVAPILLLILLIILPLRATMSPLYYCKS